MRPLICKPKVSMTSLFLTAAPNCHAILAKGKADIAHFQSYLFLLIEDTKKTF